jgi:flagellar biosynthesis protein FlgN
MTVKQSDWAELKTTFEQDLNTTSELLTRLKQERKSLESRNYDQFQHVIGEKHTLLGLLESHVSRRKQWLEQAGFVDEASALSAAKEQAPGVADVWTKLEAQWSQCKQLNAVNEQIANRTKAVVGHMLDTLRGQTNQQRLYDSKGDTQTSGSGRTISNA